MRAISRFLSLRGLSFGRALRSGALALAACGVLAACNQNPLIVELTDCPAVAFVRHTNSKTQIAPGEAAIVPNVVYQAHLSGLQIDCRDRGEGVETRISFLTSGEAGPAYANQVIDTSYFVVIAREGDRLVSKDVYPAQMKLVGQPLARGQERQVIEFTIPTNDLADAYLYEVLIGFALSNEQTRYNLLS